VLLCGLAAAVWAQEESSAQRLARLKSSLRLLSTRREPYIAPQPEQLAIIEKIARINDIAATQFVADIARDPFYAPIQDAVLRLLVKYARDSFATAAVLEEHMRPGDPNRNLARKVLLDQAIENRQDAWLLGLFEKGTLEDRFLALEGLGKIGSTHTLDLALRLLEDRSWKPQLDGPVNCGTIATSLRDQEGAKAARLLLLLQKDPRFAPQDVLAVREATRLWSIGDLRSYVDLMRLADKDPRLRAETARFLGEAGIDAAREPLIRLARNPKEAVAVRAEAARALGGLEIARGDLAQVLAGLLRGRERAVQLAAIDGLVALGVRQAAEALATEVDGDLDREARAALAKLSGLPENTDWKAWLADSKCRLPLGT